MRSFVVTRPTVQPVSLAEAKQHLNAGDDQDALIQGYIAAAVATLDGPSGWLGRAICEQVIEARFDNFDCGSLVLPYPPVIEIVSVGYVNAAGTVTTIAPTDYELLGRSLVPVFGASWPSPRWQREAVRVRYRAGYTTVPKSIWAAVLLMVGDLYNFRETAAYGAVLAVPMSVSVENLLAPLRVYA